jgi:O-antigen biosynthesis protein
VKPEVSIVVTTRNGYPFTRWCLESIACTLPEGSYEVIVVDNGSTDETTNLRREYRFVDNPVPSLYESWNVGVAAAGSDWVVCTNNDVFFCTRGWWSWLRLALESAEVDWVYPVLVETQAVVPDMYRRIGEAQALANLELRVEHGTLAACCFAIHRSLLAEIGGFDPQFGVWYGEKDYEIRLLLAGKRYGEVGNAVARHFGASTIRVTQGHQREFEFAPADAGDLDTVARRDYERFVSKHAGTPLDAIGLRLPPFGPLPLKAD